MNIDSRRVISNLLGLAGALLGGTAGYYIFLWLLDQSFYGLIIPGAMIGLGCGLASRHTSHVRGLLCGVAGLVLGLYAEWNYHAFVVDPSFTFMVTHIYEKPPLTLILLVLGAFFAYWLGKDAGLMLGSFGGNRTQPVDRREPPTTGE